jgi:hypothetical protein
MYDNGIKPGIQDLPDAYRLWCLFRWILASLSDNECAYLAGKAAPEITVIIFQLQQGLGI